jgi:hypothetical protein
MIPCTVNVVRPVFPARAPAANAAAAQRSFERQYLAAVAQVWVLQHELAWSYPRLCYAVWSRLVTLDR